MQRSCHPVTSISTGTDTGDSNFDNDNWSVRTIFDQTISGAAGPVVNAIGNINYTLAIVDSSAQYKSVRIDSASTGFGGSVLKTIIAPPISITSTNGATVEVPLSGTFVDVTDSYSVANTAGMNSFNNGFQQQDADPCLLYTSPSPRDS